MADKPSPTTTPIVIPATPHLLTISASSSSNPLYKVLDFEIGIGAYATVYLGQSLPTKTRIAVKIIQYMDASDDEDLPTSDASQYQVVYEKGKGKPHTQGVPRGAIRSARKEVRALTLLRDSGFTPKLHCNTHYDHHFYLVMDYLEGTSFKDYLDGRNSNGFPIAKAKMYFYQMCKSVKYCHDRHIAHHDLKPDNFLLIESTGEVKLIDFGLAIIMDSSLTDSSDCTDYSGTPLYSSLELLLNLPYNPYRADIWALGVILYQLLTGMFPWYAEELEIFIKEILYSPISFPLDVFQDSSVTYLILSMLRKNPKSRPTLMQVLTHEWFTNSSKCNSTT